MALTVLVLALLLQAQPAPSDPVGVLLTGKPAAADAAAPEAAPADTPPEDRIPPGAPQEDYPFVSW